MRIEEITVSSFSLSAHAQVMAQYNQWMNAQLYAAAARLDDAVRREPQGLFFGSIHGTLNHLLLVDRLWLARFSGSEYPAAGLDEELCADFAGLEAARYAEDALILRWAGTLRDAALPERLHYYSLSQGAARSVDFARVVVHFFNHQTHHRGQVTAVLSRLGQDYGTTDLIFMPGLE